MTIDLTPLLELLDEATGGPGTRRNPTGVTLLELPPDERRSLTLTIAGPPTFVSSNSRGGWFVHDKAIAAWRLVAAHEARKARPRPFVPRVVIDVTVHRTSNRKSDASNVFPSIKAAVDGLQDARLLPGDDDSHVAALTIRRGPNTAQSTLTVTITQEAS